MPTSSRIEGPASVELGKTGTGRISVICWDSGNYPTKLSYGIGYKAPGVGSGKSSWHGWKNYSDDVPCNLPFEFTFEATQELLNKQKAGNAMFVYSCDAMADRPIAGVGKGRYSYFAITQPGSAPISGRSYVATSISKRGSGDDLIVKLYADKYKDGRIDRAAQKYGGAKARPDGKVFRKYFAGFWDYVRFMRVSLYNKLAQDEKDWLIAKGVAVVPANWTPAEGVPIPKYQLTGAFTAIPTAIPISPVPGWGVKLMVDKLPVSFDLQAVSCTDILGNAVTPPNIAGRIPVMFSVDGATIASLAPASSVSMDLASLFSLWSTALTMGVTEITLTAQTATTTIDGVLVPGISVSQTIPVTEKVCTEGEKQSPETCWDGSIIHNKICINNTLVPTGETCPAMPTVGEKRSPTTCRDGSIIHAEVFDATLKRWVSTGKTCPPYIPPPVCTPYLPGDVNGDGVVDQADATLLFNWVSFVNERNTTYKLACPKNADVNGDGKVNIGDAVLLQNHVRFPNDPAYALGCTDGEKRDPSECFDGTVIHKEICRNNRWVQTGETCPEKVCTEGAKRNLETCLDGSEIHQEICLNNAWVPSGERCPDKVCTEGEKHGPLTCWDGSVINTEICRNNAWVPSGEECPPRLPERIIRMVTQKIAYTGQTIDFVVQAFCGAALSQGEPATLTIDGAEVQTKTTIAGEVRFRWTAKGVGMHKVCVNIPANPNCQVPGRVCETMMVSAYVEGIKEQIKKEKDAYDAELARLRKLKKSANAGRPRFDAPGTVRIPSTLAGMVIVVEGVPTTVPEGGIAVQVPPGESVITVIVEGINKSVPVDVLPGETIKLPKIPGGI